MIYIAVSVSNACNYCIATHTTAARAKGMSEAEFMELVAIVGMASETNRLVTALQFPIDEIFQSYPAVSQKTAPRGRRKPARRRTQAATAPQKSRSPRKA
jgi:AhpD family alkylhydroperoxidase